VKECCIIVIAQGVAEGVVERFVRSVHLSNPRVPTEIRIDSSAPSDPFCKAAALNHLLRETLDQYRVVIQTDIDLLIPPGLIDQSYQATLSHDKIAYHHVLRHVFPAEIEGKLYKDYDFKGWQNRKAIFCSGCWNAMNAISWKRTGGYHEEMVGWGYEDTYFLEKSKAMGVRWIVDAQFGLVHVNHPNRTKRNVAENRTVASKYEMRSDWLTGKLVEKQHD
jgi:hypothetical protein